MFRLLALALFALVFSVGAVASAQSQDPANLRMAARAFDDGRKAFQSEDYVLAAEQFEAADSYAPAAKALELAIVSRNKAGQLARAATLAAYAQALYPDEASLSKLSEDIIAKAEDTLHRLTVTCDEPCDLAVDNKIVHGTRAEQRVIFLNPGEYAVRAGWSEDRSDSENVVASAGEQTEIAFSAPVMAVDSPGMEDSSLGAESDTGAVDEGVKPGSGWSPIVFWTGLGLTGLAGAVTAVSAVDTLQNPGTDEVQQKCGNLPDPTQCDAYQQGRDKQQRTNILLGVTAGVGVATIVVGAFLTDWSGGEKSSSGQRKSSPRTGKIEIEPYIGFGGGATLGAVGRF